MNESKVKKIRVFLKSSNIIRSGTDDFDSEAREILSGAGQDDKAEILGQVAQWLGDVEHDDYITYSVEGVRFLCLCGPEAFKYIPLIIDTMLWDRFNAEAVGRIEDSLMLLKDGLSPHAGLLKKKLSEELQQPEFASPETLVEAIGAAGSMANQVGVFSRPNALASLLGSCGREASEAITELKKWSRLAEAIGEYGYSGIPKIARKSIAAVGEKTQPAKKKAHKNRPWWKFW